ncbi:hypothetical protein BJ928_1056 [Rhizobium sp. WW_1]|nr:hypothetical protein BJ928_1056 [Rhizobium sp. WW_1]
MCNARALILYRKFGKWLLSQAIDLLNRCYMPVVFML